MGMENSARSGAPNSRISSRSRHNHLAACPHLHSYARRTQGWTRSPTPRSPPCRGLDLACSWRGFRASSGLGQQWHSGLAPRVSTSCRMMVALAPVADRMAQVCRPMLAMPGRSMVNACILNDAESARCNRTRPGGPNADVGRRGLGGPSAGERGVARGYSKPSEPGITFSAVRGRCRSWLVVPRYLTQAESRQAPHRTPHRRRAQGGTACDRSRRQFAPSERGSVGGGRAVSEPTNSSRL